MKERQADVLIVGGGTGGCAAALGAASLGVRVVLAEPTRWIGGQLTAQAVPPDEHPWIESFGCTRRYRQLRNGVRQYYQDHYPLTPAARFDPALNPGKGWVSRLCHEFRVSLAVLEAMLAYPRSRGSLEVLLECRPVAVDTDGDTLRAVRFLHTGSGEEEVVWAKYILDATELGDLLPMAGVEYVSGAESQAETGEPHALAGPAQPEIVQSLTWCFPLGYDPQGEHLIEKPAMYDYWKTYTPVMTPAYPGRLLDWNAPVPWTLAPWKRNLFPEESADPYASLWLYRRIVCKDHYAPGAMPEEVTLVNWPQNDYWGRNIIDKPEEDVKRALEESRQLSLSLLYWLQTEAPRPDGGWARSSRHGYPGLRLRPDLVGTPDGLAMAPYIRESRRIRAVFTVTENHVGVEARQGKTEAERFEDSVGVGCYRIDLHPSAGGVNYIDISSLPFRIPLGALLPVRVKNLLPACKNLGVTHITNGCYRLHPVEWNIGESAGLLAAFCLEKGYTPHQVREDKEILKDFQALLVAQGVELEWPELKAV
jgi:glycine/D-amino acid oxidase-like deaminating enzyme